MIIAAVQIESTSGEIQSNIEKHIEAVHVAANAGAHLVAFPELSVTGYEPTLAEGLAFREPEEQLCKFFSVSKQLGVKIAVGIPTQSAPKPKISQLFVFPNGSSSVYSKQILHDDEKPYFSAGTGNYSLIAGDDVVVPAICFESLISEHTERAASQGATVYLSCVAKPDPRTQYAHGYFSKVSKTHSFVVIMSNAIGKSDCFISAGCSAAWNRKGEKIAELGADSEEILLVDTDGESARPISFSR